MKIGNDHTPEETQPVKYQDQKVEKRGLKGTIVKTKITGKRRLNSVITKTTKSEYQMVNVARIKTSRDEYQKSNVGRMKIKNTAYRKTNAGSIKTQKTEYDSHIMLETCFSGKVRDQKKESKTQQHAKCSTALRSRKEFARRSSLAKTTSMFRTVKTSGSEYSDRDISVYTL